MKAVLFGASKGMGRALARLLAAHGHRLFLLEHVVEDLERSARDLEIYGARRRSAVPVAICWNRTALPPLSIGPNGNSTASIR